MKVEKKTSNTAGWIKIPEANLRVIEAENTDLRTQLEKMMKKADAVGDAQFLIEVLTKNLNERNAENAALTEKLEKAHMDVANAEHNVAENTKQEIMMWIDKCIALEQKLVAVREWRNSNDSDWPTRYKFLSLSKLDEILDGE